jgi:hypothetical protein
MRGKLAFAVALALALVGMLAVPVGAKASLEGEQYIEFNLGFLEGGACEHITWTGEVTLNDVTYDISYEPIGDRTTGMAFHFEEIVRIHERGAIVVDEFDVVTVCPEESLLWLENSGVVQPNLKALANGKVQYVDPGGPFDEDLVGATTHWRGTVSEDFLTFSGSFRIN